MGHRARIATLLLSLVPAALGAQQPLEKAASTIHAGDFAWRVGVIAHDSMRGRNTPSPELDRTAAWIASEFRRMGLEGGGDDGGFLQRYPLEEVRVDVEGSGARVGGRTLRFGSDLAPAFGTPPSGTVDGEVVVVSGSGDAQEVASRSAMDGKHVIWVLPEDAGRINRRAFQAFGLLRDAGAASILITDWLDDATWSAHSARSLRPGVRLATGNGGQVAVLRVRGTSLAPILATAGVSLEELAARGVQDRMRVDAVEGVRLSLETRLVARPMWAPNVVGILEGSDPDLKDEYVVFSGHMDHVGVGAPDASGDSIYNGADDDASGTVSVMEVAQAMASLDPAPRRSMIFLLVSGEEKGLWGSRYFAEHPTVPVEQLVADLNTDMVGRNWPDTIVAIGKEHSDLGETLARVNARHPELNMTAIDDRWPQERFYFRSDHYNFARKGVPILFFFNGTHEDYHRPSDEPDKIDADKAARIAKLVFYLGVEIANADQRPKWNPGSYEKIVSGNR